MASEPKKAYFRPNDTAHVIERQGKKFITHVGLQMKMLDQGKSVVESDTEVLQWPWDNPLNICAMRVTMVVEKGGRKAKYRAVGDVVVSDKDKGIKANVGPKVEESWFRMAETRAHVRCLRQATRSEFTAFEELPSQE